MVTLSLSLSRSAALAFQRRLVRLRVQQWSCRAPRGAPRRLRWRYQVVLPSAPLRAIATLFAAAWARAVTQ